ncbi:MAG: TonB-dependent receptor [Gallionella sp.]
MSRNIFWSTAVAVLLANPPGALAASDTGPQSINEQIRQLQQSNARLEQRLQQDEDAAVQAPARGSAPPSSVNSFNPAVSMVLSGTYEQLQRDPAIPVTGFAMSANNTGYTRGFSLQESELGIAADIDPLFRGVGTFALAPEGGIAVENAFVQTSALGNGVNLEFGRFFSGLGYLNDQHSHVWDFVDQPLVYRVMWDNQLAEDGVQLKWLAPTDMFIEVGGELGRGLGFPGTNRQKNGAGAGVLFAHFGDDVGIENSWRAGISLHETRRENALSSNVPDLAGTVGGVSDSFTGDSRTAGLDFVWKYSPNGNISDRYLKVQSEYFQRRESGQLTYDSTGAGIAGDYTDTQSGWYLQGVYQFMPDWRTGLRYDRLDSGTASVGAPIAGDVISNYAFSPTRLTWMADYNASEFSRIRVQLAHDNSRQGLADNQLFVQYIMSLGAHGAHQY